MYIEGSLSFVRILLEPLHITKLFCRYQSEGVPLGNNLVGRAQCVQ